MIDSDLKKILKEVSSKNNTGLNILDVVYLLEDAYSYINYSYLGEISDFEETFGSKYTITKKGYDSQNNKMIYEVNDGETNLIRVEVRNNGNIRFKTSTGAPTAAKKALSILNSPSCDISEKIKMNAEVSFFTENCELVISKNPYLAIRISDSVESDKAVLVWHKGSSNCQNMSSDSNNFEYVRVEQIEPYLKNIYVDPNIVPSLSFAFYGNSEEYDHLKVFERNIYDSTYPKLTDEKVKNINKNYHLRKDETIMFGSMGGLAGFLIGGMLSAVAASVIPLVLCVGIPPVAATIIGTKLSIDYKHANIKGERIAQAKLKLYSKLKEYASFHIKEIVNQEAEQIVEEEKEEVVNDNPMDLARGIRSLLTKAPKQYAHFFNIQLLQIMNAYDQGTNEENKSLKLYARLSDLSNAIIDSKNKGLCDIISDTISFVTELNEETNLVTGLDTLNKLSDQVDSIGLSSFKLKELDELESQLTYSYIETIVGKDVSLISDISLRSIPEKHKENILNTTVDFTIQEHIPYQGYISIDEQILSVLSAIEKENKIDKLLNQNKKEKPIQKKIGTQ